jgi:energy-coupling factor transporter transmembrane protein EcfT
MFKIIFTFFLLLHGTIHLMGWAKAFDFVKVTQIHKPISKLQGIIWLMVFILFFLAAFFYLLHKNWWCIICIIAIIISQCLIIIHWQDAKYGTILNFIFLLFAIIQYASWNYYRQYENDIAKNLSSNVIISDAVLTEEHLKDLPEPIKKYIRYTGFIGKPVVNHFQIDFVGDIRKDDQSEWMPFTSEQHNFMNQPTRLFFMKAVMKYLPVAGYHCYNNGDAYMDIRLFSLFKVQYQKGAEMDMAETVTFFNDMCCMAPGTLIDERIEWLETNGNTVKAAFTNNNITIHATLYFNEKGELINFTSNDRFDADAGKKLPWSTPLKDYKDYNGYRLASYAEAIYKYPDRNLVYGTFSLSKVSYN